MRDYVVCPNCKVAPAQLNNLTKFCNSCYTGAIKSLGEVRKEAVPRKRNRYLKKTYSITQTEFELMFKDQHFMCKICKRGNNSLHKFHVDHCHKTGNIRGILCSACNKALGLFRDSVGSLENAIEYLKDNK